jgi:hypothetical protein
MDSLPNILNTEFPFEFDGGTYQVKKASLRKISLYQQRLKTLQGQDGADPLIAAYCIFLTLRDALPELTEDFVLDNVGDVDVLSLLTTLGFINPDKLKMAMRLQATDGQPSPRL